MTSLKPPRILIVEDEPDIASVLADYLRLEHCETQLVHDGLAAMQMILGNPPDLVLLDLMLPGLDGLGILRNMRAQDPHQAPIPVIMLTARVEEVDRLIGLELGADDYICKPFSPREVVARVKAVLRRKMAALLSGHEWIRSVYGVGFCLEIPVDSGQNGGGGIH